MQNYKEQIHAAFLKRKREVMDSSVVVGSGLAILGSKDIINRLLGPTADYLGGEIKHLVKKCSINLDRIFAIAARRLGKGIEKPGVVPPRILKEIIDVGSFCEDQLASEYFGGLLASSRTSDGSDDTILPYLSIIRDLPVQQLRLHYIVYALLHQLFHGKSWESPALNTSVGRTQARIWINSSELLASLVIDIEKAWSDCFERANRGLAHKNLLLYVETDRDRTGKNIRVYEPTVDGADLFMMVNGKRGHMAETFEYDLNLPRISFPMPKEFGKYMQPEKKRRTSNK
jgi:hypothetical protein